MNWLVVVLAVIASGCSKTSNAPPPSGAGSGEGDDSAGTELGRVGGDGSELAALIAKAR